MVNKGIGLLVFGLISVIVFSIFMQVQTSTNTTGWNSMSIQAITNWLPMLLLVVILLTILLGLSFKHGR
jgi:hypothetical protein